MTKDELVSKVFAEHPEIMRKDIEQVVNCLLDIIITDVASGGKVWLKGFGSFEAIHRRRKVGRIIEGGEIEIPARMIPVFKPGALFRWRVNDG